MLEWLSKLPPALIYVVVAALVFAEDALFVGFVVPGETAAVLGGVLANRGTVNIWAMAALVVFAAIVGDSVGFEVGRHSGERLLETRALRRHKARLDKARALIQRRGAEAVFLGRFVSFFRALMPPLAAISHIPYRKFLFFNALGGVVWGVGFTLLGYFAGAAYSRVEHLVGRILAGVVALVVIVGLVMWRVRRHRAESAEEEAAEEEAAEEGAQGAEQRVEGAEPEAGAGSDARSGPGSGAGAGARTSTDTDANSGPDSGAEPEASAGTTTAPDTPPAADSSPEHESPPDADHDSGGDITR